MVDLNGTSIKTLRSAAYKKMLIMLLEGGASSQVK